ncbi:MAG: hypothetical protein JXR83_14050 [Deltaproteobacteria bacterium]|nr:hypothetical protein [Deltaproteobacteria bacterium]
MIDIIRECGFAAWLSLLIFIGGLAAVFTVGRKVGRPGSVAAAFAVAVVASGALGIGAGQRMVDRAVQQQTEIAKQVEYLRIGTREAAANLLLSGACGLLLMAVGGGMALAGARREQAR